ncbi:MAG: flagellar assembly protein FliW [Nitrospirota bacterium]|nr:flagellar assembly protein FliW [Nitrospirota bacterium]MDH5586120.1 flagellar assembly protein FliW [Nitrospirota bacterium]MDH5774795.1 flagellar assembly protein FliW [Nitrospirota bacterium]
MVTIQTGRFGEIEVSAEALLTFPSGLVGFPAVQKFVVLDVAEDCQYQWFQAINEPDLAFVIIDVHLLDQQFQADISDEGMAELEITSSDPVLILAVVTIPAREPERATANLRAPLVVNLRTRKGKQLILHESIPLRFPLMRKEEPAQPATVMENEPASV